jgi:hypothetical protein
MASLDDGERSSVEVSMVIWACYPFYEGALYQAEPGTRELISLYTIAQATASVDHSKDGCTSVDGPSFDTPEVKRDTPGNKTPKLLTPPFCSLTFVA